MDFRWHNPLRCSGRAALIGLAALGGLYLVAPNLILRFGCATGIGLLLMARLGASAWERLAQIAAAMLFAAAFLLTPYASYVPAPTAVPNPPARAVLLQCGLLVVALVWFAGVWFFGRGFRAWRCRPVWPCALLFLVLFLAAVLRPWLADLTYAGDEVFHVDMIRMCNGLLRGIVSSREGWLVLACPLLTGCGIWLGLGRQRRQLLNYPRFPFAILGVNLLLVCAGAALLAYPDSFLRDGYSRGLSFRFPTGEAWTSALLMSAGLRPLPVAAEFFRFLPCLSTALLGLFLLADRRWRVLPWPAVALAGCGLVLIPNVYYHATLVYLEIPAVLLFTVALADAARLVCLPWRRVGRLPAFWALLLVGFAKEVAAPGIAVLLGVRWWRQLSLLRREGLARPPAVRRLLIESGLAAIVLLPVLLYLAVRYGQQIRPYAMRIDNWLHPALWARALFHLAVQSGPLLLLALFGAWTCWRERRYGFLLVNALFGIGVFLFFLAEKAEYIGLARFNLLLVPPLLVLGREGLLVCGRKSRTIGLTAILLLVAGNVWLAPVRLDGSRKPWGNTGESWYPFRDCLLDARDLAPHARVLFGNMPLQYGVSFVLLELGWAVASATVDISETVSEPEEITRTLSHAEQHGFDVLIYRSSLPEPVPANAPLPPGWRFARHYGDDRGRLLLFLKPAKSGSQ